MIYAIAYLIAGVLGASLGVLALCRPLFGYWPWHARISDDHFRVLYRWDNQRDKFVRR